MKIGVSGASGRLGTAVLKELGERGSGHEIIGVSRTPDNLPAGVPGVSAITTTRNHWPALMPISTGF